MHCRVCSIWVAGDLHHCSDHTDLFIAHLTWCYYTQVTQMSRSHNLRYPNMQWTLGEYVVTYLLGQVCLYRWVWFGFTMGKYLMFHLLSRLRFNVDPYCVCQLCPRLLVSPQAPRFLIPRYHHEQSEQLLCT